MKWRIYFKCTIKRAFAYLIDCIICYSGTMLIIQWLLLSHVRSSIGLMDEWFKNSLNMELYVLATISVPVWAYFSYLDSARSRGTFGKRLLKLSVTTIDNGKPGLGKSFLRTFLKLLPWEIAHLGVIFPVPIYFVEQPGIRWLTILGLLLLFTYFLTMLLNSQTIYDKLTRTSVIAQ